MPIGNNKTITSIGLHKVKCTVIPKDLSSCSDVRKIDLSYNSIFKISIFFTKMGYVEDLN